jgi:hypothetical protein
VATVPVLPPESIGGLDPAPTVALPAYRGDMPPDAVAGQPDPNLSDEFTPLRPEDVEAPQSGPRIAISDLNEFWSYNFGVIPNDQIAEHSFEAVNVGDEDLIISRIYASCGCTATVFGGTRIKEDGFLPAPVTLKPGERRPFTIQYDPRLKAESAQTVDIKYIQIYSNDATRFHYDPTEPLSHEIRFRIIMKPE